MPPIGSCWVTNDREIKQNNHSHGYHTKGEQSCGDYISVAESDANALHSDCIFWLGWEFATKWGIVEEKTTGSKWPTFAEAHDTKPRFNTWPNCSFDLPQECSLNQPVWNFLVSILEVISLLGPLHLQEEEEIYLTSFLKQWWNAHHVKLTSLSVLAQTVKNPPAMRETWVWFLGWEDPLEEGLATHSSIFAWRSTMDRGAWRAPVHGVSKSWTRLSNQAYTQVYLQFSGVKSTPVVVQKSPPSNSRTFSSCKFGRDLLDVANTFKNYNTQRGSNKPGNGHRKDILCPLMCIVSLNSLDNLWGGQLCSFHRWGN